MNLGDPDPLNVQQDELYSIYRRGIIKRHIAANGRFLESIALESVDHPSEMNLQSGNYFEIRHSAPGGERGPNIRIRIPMTAARYSIEVDLTAPVREGKYMVRPVLWVPLIAPIKYPGRPEYEEGMIKSSPAPWLPQAYQWRKYSQQKMYYVAVSSRADNPGYYGGMALATFSLEHIHQVSPHSIEYARKLVEGFLAMEMNGRNGYLIRYDRWHAKHGEIKEIRGASSEELLGVMLGILFYLRAEDPNHPLYAAALGLRERVLAKVSRGDFEWSHYEHPFMVQSFVIKHFEWPLYVSKGEERGREWFYRNLVTVSAGASRLVEGNFYDYAMFLTSMILVLEGGIAESKKEWYAEIFMKDFIKAAYTAGPHINDLKSNAYMGVVGLLCNKYLNPQRDSHFVSDKLRSCWVDYVGGVLVDRMDIWNEIVRVVDRRIAFCRSLDNEKIDFHDEDQWQHNLPLFTVFEDGEPKDWPGIWKNHNPHRRIGAHFEWHHKYPQWYRGSTWKFGDYAIGWNDSAEAMNEHSYNGSVQKRYDSIGYLEREVAGFRQHHDTAIEGSGIGLVFLRMLLTHINPAVYPPPALPDREIAWPVLPFRGVEPCEPKFLHYEHHYRSKDHNWEIRGDKDKALRLIAFPSRNVLVTACAGDEERLRFDSWRITDTAFLHLSSLIEHRFDQIVLRKTSSTGDPNNKDILVVVERSEEEKTGSDDHYLQLAMYRVFDDGSLTRRASQQITSKSASAAQKIDLCVLNYKFAVVTFKTRHNKARVKVLELDFSNNRITERAAIDAEYGTDEAHQEIADHVWIGSAWDNVLINGYESKTEPSHHFCLYGRTWTESGFGPTYQATGSASRGKPIGAVTVKRNDVYYLVVASFYPYRYEGEEHPYFILQSFEVARTGELLYRGSLEHKMNWDQEFLLRAQEYNFERLSISRAGFRRNGEFIICGKDKVGSGKGFVLLYGGITNEGKPTLWDWTCMGSGDEDSVKMVDLCGDIRIGDRRGAVTVQKDKDNGLLLTFWRFAENFDLPTPCRIDPGQRIRRSSEFDRIVEDGND